VSIEEKIRKMTSLSAEHTGLNHLGIIKPGAPADMVLFDREEFQDRATFENSSVRSDGVIMVWVNGVVVYEKNQPTGATPGKVIKRENSN